MSIDARSVLFSTHTNALVCNSLSSLYHSIVGSGFPEMPALSFTDVPALYLTTSVYSRGKSMTGPPARKQTKKQLKSYQDEKGSCRNFEIGNWPFANCVHMCCVYYLPV